MTPLICTIGDLLLDVVVLPDVPLARDGDTPATIRLAAGGQAANVAAWAAALGGRGRLVCARGTDRASELAETELRRHGVEIRGPVIAGRGGVVVSTREPDGARTMASDPGVAAGLTAACVRPAWVVDADVLHISGYCLLREEMAGAAIAAARHARRVSVDLASAHDIALAGAPRFTERLRALRPALVLATEAEHAAVGTIDTAWVIKHGARGATFPEGHLPAAALDAPGALDATGAGDALAAGYLVGGPSLAIAAAARCVASVGAMPPEPAGPIGHVDDRL